LLAAAWHPHAPPCGHGVQQLHPSQLPDGQRPFLPIQGQQQIMCLRTWAGSSRPPRDQDKQRGRHKQHQHGSLRRQQRGSLHRQQQEPPPRQQQAPPPRQHRQWQQQAPDLAQLTTLIYSSSSPRELLERVVANHAAMKPSHIIAVMQRATQLWPQTGAPAETTPAAERPRAKHMPAGQPAGRSSSSDPPLVGRQQLERLMLQLSKPFVRALPDYSAREVAGALWCFAKCGLQPPAEMMQAALQELCSWDKVQKVRRVHHQYLITPAQG
jgi:hypothetical protein